MNYQKVIIYFLITLHLIGLASIVLYGLKTNSVCKISIVSNSPITVQAKTPLGKIVNFKSATSDTLIIPYRPWRSVSLITNDGNFEIKNFDKLHRIINADNSLIKYKTEQKAKYKYAGLFEFINNLFPWLLPIYIFSILLISFFILLIKENQLIPFRLIKINIFRWLLKTKRNSILHKNKGLTFNKFQKIWMLILCTLMLVSLYMNLGKYPYGQDAEEKRRALVSLEMKINDNYVVPTTNGEKYLNKPPLFNWLLLPVIQNDNVEQQTRAISVSILILLAVTVFLLLRKNRGWPEALFISIAFLASWHVLSYLSFITNIDGLFALLLVLTFYLNFRFASEGKSLKLFIIGYGLFSMAFLTKGIPAIWFFSLSIFLSLLINKSLKLLLSWQHLIGICIAILLLGSYWSIYSASANPMPFLKQLIKETQINDRYSLTEKISHILSFPAINIMSYRPVLVLLPIVFFRNNILQVIKSKEQSYLLLLALSGCTIFLTSPYYMPYYILMLIPLLIDLITKSLHNFKYLNIQNSLKLPIWLAIIFTPYILAYKTDNLWTTSIIIVLGLLFALFRKRITYLLLGLFTIIVLIKAFGDMGYYTDEYQFNTPTRSDCERIVKTNSKELSILKEDDLINYVSIFYLTYYSNQIIPISESPDNENILYLTTVPNKYVDFEISDSIQQYVWIFDESKKSKGISIYKPLYLITKK